MPKDTAGAATASVAIGPAPALAQLWHRQARGPVFFAVTTVFTGIGAFAYGYGHLAHTIADLLLRR